MADCGKYRCLSRFMPSVGGAHGRRGSTKAPRAMIGQRLRFRGLFRKYFLVLFLAVVIPLAANGVSEAWFGYRDQRAGVDRLLKVEATAAAARIQGFLDDI